ncbi:hypothetical protein SAMN05518865_102379 [Duganella sp. CF458]|uniref:hypothetical protein n=1 Tax=Duganella sp. CF458 TaxID=1884368 RepID=UPI0008F22A0D|nr:hypothetical protein [Duganella sp. CF458]SFF63954.1 hypothetical protein SAMN05518865_102379 [Duganella sp. CF458]
MSKPQSAAQLGPNLWHFSALVWGTSLLLLSLFAMPISVNPLGMRLQLCLTAAHLGGVFYMWRLGRRGNPERLIDIAIVTLVFIYVVPLCMLAAPVIVLAAYAMHSDAWRTTIAIMIACGVALALLRLWSTATDKNTGHCFETCLAERLRGGTIHASSLTGLLNHVGRQATEPSRIDGWSMIAAVAAGAPILAANIDYDRASGSLALCALATTPMAMHAFSRMVVHAYLWVFRLHRFERETGVKIAVHLHSGS